MEEGVTRGGHVAAPTFPGRIIKKGDPDPAIVKTIQRQLNARGCGPIAVDGVFDRPTEDAVKLFQARFPDVEGAPLIIDGKVGSITWAALFGADTVPAEDTPASPLLEKALAIATSQIGVMEQPPGSNRGPEVDEYVRRVGLNPAKKHPWCVAFLFFCFDEAAKSLGRGNPMIKTAGVLDHWARAGAQGIPRVTKAKAEQNPALVKPGQIFTIDTGGGFGHAGFVLEVVGGKLITVEGNTNDTGSRDGIGVFRRQSRKILSINKGFVDYNGL
jgi:peptidoglycan hydrolase-like protein with peptidoglycan-binding domain